eukprot:TRINITY_DN56347_c0_g1_i1.p1 TRINITY_DN56347_c0_g1~~TRINITY_DN56347_c0_g1_i1.p1  ORF type:complete len:192 (+),score=26.26 TRINITY_DN56347_c0_g1_i1:184-759(+)
MPSSPLVLSLPQSRACGREPAVLAIRVFLRQIAVDGAAWSPRSSQELSRAVSPQEVIGARPQLMQPLPGLAFAVRSSDRLARALRRRLLEAARCGDISSVASALADGAEPETRDAFGWTSLHLAARQEQLEISKLLIAARANINAVNVVDALRAHVTPLAALPPFESIKPRTRVDLERRKALEVLLGGRSS